MANGDANRALSVSLRAIAADIAVAADSRWSFWQFRFGPFGDRLFEKSPSRRAITRHSRHNHDNNAALERERARRVV